VISEKAIEKSRFEWLLGMAFEKLCVSRRHREWSFQNHLLEGFERAKRHRKIPTDVEIVKSAQKWESRQKSQTDPWSLAIYFDFTFSSEIVPQKSIMFWAWQFCNRSSRWTVSSMQFPSSFRQQLRCPEGAMTSHCQSVKSISMDIVKREERA
jgi:hypothetical protein